MSDREESVDRHENGSNAGSYRDENGDNGGGGRGGSRDRASPSSRQRDRSRSGSRSRSGRKRYSRSRSRDRDNEYSSERRRGSRERSRSPMSSRRRHTGHRENPPPGRCLGVFGLSIYTHERDLKEVLGKYGPIEDVQIVYDAQTGRSRGFAFVYFENDADAEVAKNRCNGIEIDGRKIRVDFSITQRAHTPTPGIYMGKPRRRDPGPRSSGGGGGGGGSYSGHQAQSHDYRSRPRDSREDYHRGSRDDFGHHGRSDYGRHTRDYGHHDPYPHSRALPPSSSHYEDRYRDNGYGSSRGGGDRRHSPSPYSSTYQSHRAGGGGGSYRGRSRSCSPARKYSSSYY